MHAPLHFAAQNLVRRFVHCDPAVFSGNGMEGSGLGQPVEDFRSKVAGDIHFIGGGG